jgi:phosphatidylglycerol---prolipoprotein diacylglyceryl transferase
MLGTAFYTAFLLLEREVKRVGKNPDIAYNILIMAIVGGIAGAKIFHVLDHLQDFTRDPKGMLLSGAGLSVMGGYVFAILGAYGVIRFMKEDFLEIVDLAAPAMSIGYAIGRIGCHVSGDGCYGITTSMGIGVAYPNGISPISTTVFPTPLFESLFAFLLTGILLQLAAISLPKGFRFFLYLVLSGLARFTVEFIRTNPKILGALTQAQITGIAFSVIGIAGIIYVYTRKKAVTS